MIIKKTIFGAAVVALIAPTMLATSVHADSTSLNTTAKVAFTGNPSSPQGPVNPTDPSNPSNPDNPGSPSNPNTNPDQPVNPSRPTDGTGALWLITAPSFDFGSHDIAKGALSSLNPTLNGKNTSKLYYAQVSDTRTGGLGWNLTVSNSPFTGAKTTDGTNVGDVLTGAKLTIGQATSVYNSASATPSTPVTTGYTSTAQTLNGDGKSSSAPVLVAAKGSGNLTTTINWAPTQIKLDTPVYAAVSGETYTSTLTWTLASTQG